jgi:hypothetical protein
MIKQTLFTLAFVCGVGLLGMYLIPLPPFYLRFLGIWVVPFWIAAGVLGGVYLAGPVLQTGELPKSMRPPYQDREADMAELVFRMGLRPTVHVSALSMAAGLVLFAFTAGRKAFADNPSYWFASFFIGLIAGGCQGGLDLLIPLLLRRFINRNDN